uniref:Uncharacterized protein n=1 Tax=Amphiprion ocellaris TaxID=80972 RepID=A0A3Q1D4C7_AMPOC
MLRNTKSRGEITAETFCQLPSASGNTASKQPEMGKARPNVQTTCSGSYWCTVVCTLVRLCKEVPQQPTNVCLFSVLCRLNSELLCCTLTMRSM